MKTKPVSHKNKNTFKYESFRERLSRVTISSLHHRKRYDDDDEQITFFAHTLSKWYDLNCTNDFEQLKHSIGSYVTVQSLPQIVHRKDEIIEIIVKNIEKTDNKCMNVILELIVALSRDLISDFYPYFSRIFHHLVDVLQQTSDTELIEQIFVCFAHLFKYLWRYIVDDFNQIYSLYSERLISNRKDYIRQFACEAFSYLIRKNPDKHNAIKLLFNSVEHNNALTDGIGQLLFETIKGIHNKLNSGANEIFSIIVKQYLELSNDVSLNTIQFMVKCLANYLDAKNSDIIWNELLIDPLSHTLTEMTRITDLLEFVIQYNNCGFINDPTKVTLYTCSLLKIGLNENSNLKVITSLQYLIQCYEKVIKDDDLKVVIRSVYLNPSLLSSHIFNYSRNVFDCQTFDKHFLPPLLEYCSKYLCNELDYTETLDLLSDLLLFKCSRPFYGDDLNQFLAYPLNFNDKNDKIIDFLTSIITKSKDLLCLRQCLICIPNIVSSNNDKISISIAKLIKNLEKRFGKTYDDQSMQSVLSEAIFSLILILKQNKSSHLTTLISENFLFDLLRSYPLNTEVLRSLDLYLTFVKTYENHIMEAQKLEDIYCYSLRQNLSSHLRVNRFLSLHIMTLFELQMPQSNEEFGERNSIFNICLDSEKIVASIYNYREKLINLQKLEFPVSKKFIPLGITSPSLFDLMPVHYLLGTLTENFALLWTPIQKLIASYGKGYSDTKRFLSVIFDHFHVTSERIRSNEESVINENSFSNGIEHHIQINERPNHANHRLLLLGIFDLMSDLIEPRNREFITQFLEYINVEMLQLNIISERIFEDISLNEEQEMESKECESNVQSDNDRDDNEDDENEDESVPMSSKPESNIRFILWKTLLSYLEIFSKFKNPRALYQESELKELYFNLLKFRDSRVQTAAFKCILSYNMPYLNQYRDNLLNIIDDKTFKSALLSFSINSENPEDNVLQNEHRNDILPVLMRILYGKMLPSNNVKSKGKHYSDYRRSIIMRTLAGCEQKEIITFLNHSFSPILLFISEDYENLKEKVESSIDLKRFIPLTHLRALFNSLNFLLEYLGNNSIDMTKYIFKVLMVMAAIISFLLSKRKLIKKSAVSRIKSLRVSTVKTAIKFFGYFDYPLTNAEVESLFDFIVWPMLPLLNNESLTSPSPLLRLFECWSKNQRYFSLLSQRQSSEELTNPMNSVAILYDNEKTKPSVIFIITNIFENLLFGDNETEESMIDNENLMSNFGETLIIPHIPVILRRFRSKFLCNNKNSFTIRELNILSRLSIFIDDCEENIMLLKLLIGALKSKGKKSDDFELQTLRTSVELAKKASHNGNELLNLISPLFGLINGRISRSVLCSLLEILCKGDNSKADISSVVMQINSFNPKSPEEPDYDLRLKGFKIINERFGDTSDKFDADFALIIIHNCCYFIRTSEDLTIRESSSHSIKILTEKFAKIKNENLFSKFAINLLLNCEIRNGIRHKLETVRHEFIDILVSLIQNCNDKHPILKQLALLTNNIEPEVDFWINIRHIQIHRRSRALSRLAHDSKLLSSFSPQILTFLLPLASGFLNDQRYAKYNHLLESSINLIGSLCWYLPWKTYSNLLRKYVKILIEKKENQKREYNQKIIAKVVSSILNNFSFDLSSLQLEDVNNESDNFNRKQLNENNVSESNDNLKDKPKRQISNQMAKNIYDTLTKAVLPQLHECLHQKSRIDYAHDAMKNEYPEDEEIQRIPIAFAMIKLLQSLPSKFGILELNIPSIFLRLCQFLQSRAESIREASRSIFTKIMQCLGAHYFQYALKELRATLTKGYQLHILTFTVHNLLAGIESQMHTGDLDKSLDSLIDICNLEIFGKINEEKSVSKITTSVKEAKKCKSFESYQIIARFVSEESITRLVHPLKELLLEAHNFKIIKKIALCLNKISMGFIQNNGLSEKTLLLFVYGILNDSIPDLNLKKKSITKQNSGKTLSKASDESKSTQNAKLNPNANAHILAEFAFQLLHFLLKRNRLNATDKVHVSLLDPFISLIENFLDSKNAKLNATSIKCLIILIEKFSNLQSIKKHSKTIVKEIFLLIHKYVGTGSAHSENANLVALCFKTIGLFVCDIRDFKLNNDQLKVLLTYIEHDIYDESRQSTAFTLLKAMLSRKFEMQELENIMTKIADISIQSETDHIREKCRHLWAKYFANYTHGTKFKTNISFFLRNLEYEHETGRESAIEVIGTIVSTYSRNTLMAHIGLIFVPLASRLVNETSPKCKKSAANVIIKLLSNIEYDDRSLVFNSFIFQWFRETDILQQQLAANLCALFIDIEKEHFSKRFTQCLPLIRLKLDPDQYQHVPDSHDNQMSKNYDNLIFQLLNILLKLMKVYPDINKKINWSEDMNIVWNYIQNHYFLHPHLWIRLISLQLYGLLFSNYSAEIIGNSIANPNECHNEYIHSHTEKKLVNITKKLCLTFRDIYGEETLADQLVKNLVFIARVIISLPEDRENGNALNEHLSLKWMTNIILREVKYEISNNETQHLKRICAFKWIAAVSIALGNDRIEDYLSMFLVPLCREFTTINESNQQTQLTSLTKQVLDIIKNIVGSEKFTQYLNHVRNNLTHKRLERKKKRALEVVSDPIRAAKRRIKKHVTDTASKKRKLSSVKIRGKRARLT